MRKGLLLLLAVLLLLPAVSFSEEEAKAYLICPMDSTEALSEHCAEERFSVAGLSKLPAILTLCHAIDNGWLSLTDTVTCSKRACSVNGPTAFLETGETVLAEELLKAAVMISAGDAIYALMEHAFGSETVFLENVSVLLRELDISVPYTDALGRETDLSCAELCRLGMRAVQSESFCRYAATYQDVLTHADGRITELVSPNRMIRSLEGCIGVLTGSSNEDGYCAVIAAKRGEEAYVAALIGAKTSEQRFSRLTQLFDEVYANYALKTPARQGEALVTAYPVEGGETKTVDLLSEDTVVLLLPKNGQSLTVVTDLAESLFAPLEKETAVGTASFLNEAGETLAVTRLYPKEDVPSFGVVEVMKRFAAAFVGIAQ